MSTTSGPRTPGSASPETPSSPSSSRPQRDASVAGRFSLPSSPRLDTITEHMATTQIGRHGSVSSISFLPPTEMSGVSWAESKPRKLGRRRTLSPPAPSKFEPHVSFDNFAGGEPTESNTISLTLNEKHRGYQHNRRSRTFMVGVDENAYSNYALQWMLDEMVDDGDEIICLHVVEKDSKISNDKSVTQKSYQKEAKRLMKEIQDKNAEQRSISIVLEFAVGKLQQTFQKMIQLYEPAMLIVGTRGRSLGGVQGLINNRNSFSKWCLQYSPVPVVVVRPNDKRDKKKKKRVNDPTRHNYANMLEGSSLGTHEANLLPSRSDIPVEILPTRTPDDEAHEVAAALGLPARFDPTIRLLDVNKRLHAHAQQKQTQTRTQTHSTTASQESLFDSRPSTPGGGGTLKSSVADSRGASDDESGDDDDEFEVMPGGALIGDVPEALEKQQKLQAMEQGEAAALAAGRKRSLESVDSSISNSGNDQG
ncbi:hypothetical protein VF21_02130 [Pseudogymnoascus sp. 05NY08]|nr:hypothetical protein VF21_02130 [Pseudogymnoascus sp. 05NY08]